MRGVSVLFFTLVFSLTAAGAFGLDFGIDLSDEASAAQTFSSDDTADIYHDITASLWVRSPFKDGAFSVKGGAVYDTETQKGSPSLTALNWTGFLDSQ
ncbi:MAG: hypothetical protein JXB03_07065, partial [Spirochaetales bacterium]|nr:hypothetical protein [Spirochaetales bacterium]